MRPRVSVNRQTAHHSLVYARLWSTSSANLSTRASKRLPTSATACTPGVEMDLALGSVSRSSIAWPTLHDRCHPERSSRVLVHFKHREPTQIRIVRRRAPDPCRCSAIRGMVKLLNHERATTSPLVSSRVQIALELPLGRRETLSARLPAGVSVFLRPTYQADNIERQLSATQIVAERCDVGSVGCPRHRPVGRESPAHRADKRSRSSPDRSRCLHE